jgi:ubiquinone/menaquinone biosynthesis C-methylase UbiE
MKYLFAGKETAAKRLEKLNEVFSRSSEVFVKSNIKNKINVCIDLGCGPGGTTRSLASWINPVECTGLDNSEYFILRAQKLSENCPAIKYKLHDVTKIPFPAKKADLIYARFLLTHLENPVECMKKWSTQLNPGGMLLIEETEYIKTNVPVFQKYLAVVERMLDSNKNLLYVGKLPDDSRYEPEFSEKFSEIRKVSAAVKDAAGIFLLNIPSWKNNEFIRENYSDPEIMEMENELSKLLSAGERENNSRFIEWGLRQIALRKSIN